MTSEEFPDALPLGTIVGGFRLTRVIGQGGFGITYEGVSAAGLTTRRVAIKEFFPQGHAYRVGSEIRLTRNLDQAVWLSVQRRFETETLKLVDEYDHPAIVKGENFVREHGSSFLIMEFVEGPSLAQWIQGLEKPPNEAQVRAIMDPVLDAVAYLHARGEMHRDLSPHNILVRTMRRGRAVLEPVLIDFGAAGAGLDLNRVSSVVVANLNYAPLEQLRPNVGTQGTYTDIYALGGVLYYCVAGKAPVPAEERTAASYLGEDNSGYVPASKLGATARFSVAFLFGVEAALKIRPSERPQSVAQLRAALGWAEAPAQAAPARPPVQEAPKKEERPQEAPAPKAAAEVAPAKEAPAEEVPTKADIRQDTPSKETPSKDAPGKDAPSKEAPARESPGRATPGQGKPAKDSAGKAGPGRSSSAPPSTPPNGHPPADKPRSRLPAYLVMFALMAVLGGLGAFFLVPKDEASSPLSSTSDSPLNALLAACGAGQSGSCAEAARRFAEGEGVPSNQKRAVALDVMACEAGDISSCFLAGTDFNEGLGVPVDHVRAAQLYEKACAGGEERGCYEAGALFAKGLGVAEDQKRANALFLKACEGGNAHGCNSAGAQFTKGLGVAQDQKRANALFLKACVGGAPDGCSNAGFQFRDGLGAAEDQKRANALFLKACEAGVAEGCSNAGLQFSKGQGVAVDQKRATELYLKACDGRNQTGCSNAAFQFAQGAGAPKDQKRATQLFIKGCEAGSLSSCKEAVSRIGAAQGLSASSREVWNFLQQRCAAGGNDACALIVNPNP